MRSPSATNGAGPPQAPALSVEEAAALVVAGDPTFSRFTLAQLRSTLAGLGPDEQWRRRRIEAAAARMEAIQAAEKAHGYRAVAEAAMRLRVAGKEGRRK